MPRIADVLERESRTVDLEQGDFERLLGRRERKERNRRIRAGAAGVIVALATGFVLVRSLTSDGIPADRPVEPRPAPAASGPLVYASFDGDIYVADPDGTNAVMITPVDDECRGGYRLPSWSPDGRYLAFRACERSVITDPQGNVVSTLPSNAQLVWSPDSTRVAVWDEYCCDEDGVGTDTIGIYGIDGARQTQITIPPGYDQFYQLDPFWTPDGASLIVNRLVVPLDGGTPRELPSPEAFRSAPGVWWAAPLAYSPDGSRIAYGTRHALMVARSDGSEPREVLGDAAPLTATWSPTGGLIAVTAGPPGDAWAANQLRVVDVATGSATLLFEGEPRTTLSVIGFSPEGDRVLFGEQRALSVPNGSYLYSLWSVGVDGSDARPIVSGTIDGEWRSR